MPLRSDRTTRSPLAATLLLALLLSACGDGGSPVDNHSSVAAVTAVAGDGQTGTVGAALADSLRVRVSDADGNPLSAVTVTWSVESGGGSVTPTSLTNAAGFARARWTLGTTAGPGTVRATASGIGAGFSSSALPGATASVTLTPATLTLDAGTQRQLQVAVADEYGNALTGRPASWSSSEPLVALVDGTGLVSALAGGTASIRVTVDAKTAAASLTVNGTPAPLPAISGIEPALLTPGIPATITGVNFSAAAGATTVTVNGAAATVTAVTTTEARVVVPAQSALGCLPTGTVQVTVKVGSSSASRPHPLRTGTMRTLAPGGAFIGSAVDPFGCTELPAASGRYLITVFNTAGAPASQQFVAIGPGIQLRSAVAAGGNVVEVPQATPAAAAADASSQFGSDSPLQERLRSHLRAHTRLMRESEELLARVQLPERTRIAGQAALVSQPPAVGDSLWIRYPDIAKSSSTSICSQFDSIRARVAYVGTRAIVLEDIAAPLATRIDSLYQRMGAEFDTAQYGIVRDNFADPLTLDAQLNNDGHIYMLFTRRVNNTGSGGLLGFTWGGDFDSGLNCRQSNRAEIFYGIVPTQLSGSTTGADFSVGEWLWLSRSTVIHEVKHLASMAARMQAGSFSLGDEMWLEEATAMTAEEIWARRVYGYAQRGNVGFNASLLREYNERATMPLIMFNHFGFLYDYYSSPDSLSFLGQTSTDDVSFYGSAWAFLRWATDHSGRTEGEFLRGITQAATTGLNSIEALTGRSYQQLAGEFALASALDDRGGFTPLSARLSQPSWNTRDIFFGLNQTFQNFLLPIPLIPRSVNPGSNTVSQVRPGGAAYFEFEVPSTGAQAIQVLGPLVNGVTLPLSSELRVAIVRLQ